MFLIETVIPGTNATPLRHRFCNMYSVTLLWHKNVRENVQLIQGFSLASFRIFLGKLSYDAFLDVFSKFSENTLSKTLKL